jgi:S-adenosylmethionine decarboxylase proenzyme
LDTFGRHLLVELHGCCTDKLDDKQTIETLMTRAARAAGATVVGTLFHTFAPQGVSGVVVVEESHLSIHTWPEHRYAAVDMFTCGECEPDRARDVLAEGLEARRAEILLIERGLDPEGAAMRVVRHAASDRVPGTAARVLPFRTADGRRA